VPPEAAVPALRVLSTSDLPFLLDLLDKGPETALVPVARALGQEGEAHEAVLVALCQDRDASRQLAGIAGLAEMAAQGSRLAVDRLGALLGDPNGGVRWAAAAALGRARGRASTRGAITWLERAVATGDVRAMAGAAFGAAAISALAPVKATAIMRGAAESGASGRRATAMAMRELPWRVGRRLLRLYTGGSDSEVQRHLVPALVRWTGEGSATAHRQLRRLAESMHPGVRAAVAEALAEGCDAGQADLLRRFAEDPSAMVRAAAAPALARLAGEEGKALLLQLATDRAAVVRTAAVKCLGAIGEQQAVHEACGDKAAQVRAAAASALACEDRYDAELLLRLIKDSDADVVASAARSLGRVHGALAEPIREHLMDLASQPATRLAAAEGMAVAFDRSPRSLADAWFWWPADRLGAEVLWRIAGVSRVPLVAHAARMLARLLHEGDAPGEALREVVTSPHTLGIAELAPRLEWIASCAEARTPDQIAALAEAAPPRRSVVWSSLEEASRTIRRALRAKGEVARQRAILATLEHINATLCQGRDTVSQVIAYHIAWQWREALERMDGDGERAEIRAVVASSQVVAGERPTALISLENTGRGPAHDVEVHIGGHRLALGAVPPGGSLEAVAPLPAAAVGPLMVQGEVAFRDRTEERRAPLEGRVMAVAPGRLRVHENPYVVGKPLSSGSAMFFGRAADIAFVERALSSGQEGAVAVLVGPRRSGKTSILKRLEERLAGRFRPVFIDVQGMLVSDTSAMFREIAHRVVGDEGVEWMAREGEDGSHASGAEMVREAVTHAGDEVVLLLDEFDDLEQKVRARQLGPEVFGQLRHLIQHGENIRFVLSGTHRLEELAGEHWSFLLNLATYRRLGPLAGGEAEALIRRPLEALGLVCGDAAVSLATRLAGRQPYLLQLLGYRMVERSLEQGKDAADVELVEAAAEEVVEQGEIHLRYLWDSAGPHGQVVLSALAQAGSWTSQAGLEQVTGLRSRELARVVRTLKDFDTIAEEEGWFCLQIGLLGRWVTKRL